MTQDQKDLLLKDLCGRLPYGVKVQTAYPDTKILEGIQFPDYIGISDGYYSLDVMECKPYLFPLSSMTEEQRKYISDRWGVNEDFDFEIDPNWGRFFVELGDVVGFINWCYENHLDINGLILKDLAIDATGLNIY